MHKYIFLLSALAVCGFSQELESLTGTPIEQCLNCICYAKTGSWDISLCGRRLVTLPYWRTAGSLSTTTDRRPPFNWRSCKSDNNCILNTIKRYTEQFGELDCNVDGEFNCQDRFGIQIWKNNCVNRRIAPAFFNRFQACLPNVIQANKGVIININQIVQGDNNSINQTVVLDSKGLEELA